MMVSVREYYVRRYEEILVISTRSQPYLEEEITRVNVAPWIDIEDTRAWHVQPYGDLVAYALLLHHLSLGRDGRESQLAATYWRRKFARHVLAGCIDTSVHLTDVFLNAWFVEQMLDEVKSAWWPPGLRHTAIHTAN